jgi:hypothetical protein
LCSTHYIERGGILLCWCGKVPYFKLILWKHFMDHVIVPSKLFYSIETFLVKIFSLSRFLSVSISTLSSRNVWQILALFLRILHHLLLYIIPPFCMHIKSWEFGHYDFTISWVYLHTHSLIRKIKNNSQTVAPIFLTLELCISHFHFFATSQLLHEILAYA